MERRHIDTRFQHERVLITFFLLVTDAVGGGGDDIRKKDLVFLIIAGEKSAERIDLLMLILEESTEITFRLGLFLRVIHIEQGFGFFFIGLDSTINISIK